MGNKTAASGAAGNSDTPEETNYEKVLEKYRTTGEEWKKVRDVVNTCWAGLLPDKSNGGTLDPLLRLELVKYGDLNTAVYNGFTSQGNHGEQLHLPRDLLPQVAQYTWSKISDRYEILGDDDYFYASPQLYGEESNKEPTWLGYIAITKDSAMKHELHGKKDIVVVFRGTILGPEWFKDALIYAKQYDTIRGTWHFRDEQPTWRPTDRHEFAMHTGFHQMYTTSPALGGDSNDFTRPSKEKSPMDAVRDRLLQLVEANPGKIGSITFVGHSLGGALAAIAAADIGVLRKFYKTFQKGDWQTLSLAAFTFASPRVADDPFRKLLRSPRFKDDPEPMAPLLNVANVGDVVPCIPAGLKVIPHTITGWLLTYLNTTASGLTAISTRAFYWCGVVVGDRLPGIWQYTDNGTVLLVDSAKNKVMRGFGPTDLGPHHNMEGYVYNAARQHASSEKLPIFRDFALLNRDQDILIKALSETYGLPAKWIEDDAVKHRIGAVLVGDNYIYENKDHPRPRPGPSNATAPRQ